MIVRIIFICMTITVPVTLAHGFDVDMVSREVQKTYDSMQSMQAQFEQKSTVQGMEHRGEYGKGTVIIQKPGQLRWDYEQPHYKVLVSDGLDISFYVREDKQMFVSPASDYLKEDITYRFFTGQVNILVDFKVAEADATLQQEQHYCLKLIPQRESGQVKHLYIWVDRKSYQLQRIQLVDHINTRTDFRFSEIVMNKVYPDSVFVFSPPKGTEIILPEGASVIQ
jgi:outer membrane lipoprotein carrier protein